ncbi:hypothetical protein [Mucilaginibacter segetis]|uniref:Lipoprotein n=1 Tax=Mucilaginibacter segetis TaxID=2793071 RepID=A0A934PSR2_9SPHI|nr:hypothetical protein [Mucilaginibacter segetis]MBK0378350.1 hypothetical protein [Mucilaginibacter segetis]
MKKFYLLLLCSVFVLASCSSTKKVFSANHPQDGKSYETAVIITETHEKPGIDAEYAWLKEHYPGYKTRSQALTYKDKRPYDIINITTADGKELSVYFDINNFYGKF